VVRRTATRGTSYQRFAPAQVLLHDHYAEYGHLIVNDDLDRAYQVLRAIYLTRRYGECDRADNAYPLGQLADLVRSNAASGAADHARALVGTDAKHR
jgi:hypothetical protein